MRTRLIALIAIALTTSLRAQAPYDPVKPQIGAFLLGTCGNGGATNGEPCYYFAVMDDDGYREIYYPTVDDRPRWSPDGRSVVAGSAGEIVVVSLPSGSQINLTNNPANDGTPAWSPDGAKIAFYSDRDGTPDLYVMNANGSNVTHITTGVGRASWPSWSPDGTRLAFNCALTPTAQSDICAINVDGTGFVRLTDDPADDSFPAWSPDGSKIMFSTARFGDPELVVMSASGGPITRLSPGMLAYIADWSPDGQRIAFDSIDYYSGGERPLSETFVMNADGTNMTMIAWGYSPSWRPMTGVGVNNRPAASFTYTCTNTTCAFTSTSADSDGTVAAYAWDFGYGAKSADVNPTHTFAPGASYGVQLIVMDNQGALGYVVQSVDLNQPPVASFTYSCTNLTCVFDGSSSYDPDGGITWYSWSYNPGSGAYQTDTHSFPAAGTYNVTLTVWDTDNKQASSTRSVTVTGANAPPVASFSFHCSTLQCTFDSSSSDSDGTITDSSWNFGDGTTSPYGTHIYAAAGSYNVTLTVTDNNNATASQTKTVTVSNVAPTASFTVLSCVQLSCSFDGSASSDSDGSVSWWSWNFGDGTSDIGRITYSHAYPSPGDYTVTLTVTDNVGAKGTVSKTVHVPSAPPTSSFSFSCNSMTCSFDGSSSSDPDGTIVSYSWDFGDGAHASGPTASHTYLSPGTYTVWLTVLDNDSGTATASRTVTAIQPEVHIGDLDGSAQRAGNSWSGSVTITVHNAGHMPVAGASVTGAWSVDGSATCTTSAAGQCTLTLVIANKNASAIFTVTGVIASGAIYKPSNNHDPDGDSNGTAILLRKP